jgi:hypothetical protein
LLRFINTGRNRGLVTSANLFSAISLIAFAPLSLNAQTPFVTDDTDVTPKRHFHFQFHNPLPISEDHFHFISKMVISRLEIEPGR